MNDEHNNGPFGQQEQLFQELNDHLLTLLSDEQIQFCTDHHVVSAGQMYIIRETLGQVRRFMGIIGLAGSPNSDSLRQTLLRTVLEFAEHVKRSCRQRRIRPMTEATAAELGQLWQQLSSAYDDKTKEHAILTRLMADVQLLKKAWRHPTQVESVLASILASSSLFSNTATTINSARSSNQPMYYVAAIDRRNYAQLGLHRKSLGTRQIVFECARVSRKEQIAAIVDICNRFQSIFMQNAQLNLVGIQSQLDLARPSQLARQLKRLFDRVFYQPGDMDDDDDEEGWARSRQQQQQQQQQRRQRVLSFQGYSGTTSSTTPFRLTLPMTTASFIWYPRSDDGEDDFPIAAMPPPSFVPAPWQWADLIRARVPYHAVLFGLIRRRKRHVYRGWGRRWRASRPRLTAASGIEGEISESQVAEAGDNNDDGDQNDDLAGGVFDSEQDQGEFATVSVEELSKHFSRVGHQFYEDLANNAKLGYHQDSRILEGIGQDLVEIYTSLELERLRLKTNRIMEIVHHIGKLHQQQGLVENTSQVQSQSAASATGARPSVE